MISIKQPFYCLLFVMASVLSLGEEKTCALEVQANDLFGNKITLHNAQLTMKGDKAKVFTFRFPEIEKPIMLRCGIYSSILEVDNFRTQSGEIQLLEDLVVRFGLPFNAIYASQNSMVELRLKSELPAVQMASWRWILVSQYGDFVYSGMLTKNNTVQFGQVESGYYCVARLSSSGVIWSSQVLINIEDRQFTITLNEKEKLDFRITSTAFR